MDYRIIYEYLLRKAFDCQRFDYHFVKADCYDFAHEHLSETFAYIECAIVCFLKENRDFKELKQILDEIFDKRTANNLTCVFLDEVPGKVNNLLKIY